MSEGGTTLGVWRWRIATAALIALHAALLAPILAGPEPAGDDLSIHMAEAAGLARALEAGDVHMWNDTANLGFPSLYYYQSLPQLAVAVTHVLLPFASLATWFELFVILPLALLPAAVFRALRVVGASPSHAFAAAAAAGFTHSTSTWGLGVDSIFTNGLYTQAWAFVFYPLACAYAWRYVRAGEHLGRAVGYTIAAAACHPFVGLCAGITVAATPWWRAGLRHIARRAAILGALVAIASAFLWLPLLVHGDSFGGFPARVAGESGISAPELASMIARGELLDGGRVPLLTAALGLALAIVAVARPAGIVAVLLAQAAVFAVLVGLGPVIGRIGGDLLPGVRFLASMQLAAACAAAIACAVGVERVADRWGPRTGRAVAAVLLTTLVVTGGRHVLDRAKTTDDYPQSHRDELAEVLDFLATAPPGRVFASREHGTGTHWWMYLPAVYADRPAVRAYGGAALQSSANYVFLRHIDPHGHARMVAARYLLVRGASPPRVDGIDVVFETERFFVVELSPGMQFAPIRVDGALAQDRRERGRATMRWLAAAESRRDTHPTLGRDEGAYGVAPDGRVLWESVAPSELIAHLETGGPAPTTFRVATTYHPGWRATIDGAPAPVRRIAPDLMAIDVPPGIHLVRLRFRRPWWSWLALALSAMTLVAAALHARGRCAPTRQDARRRDRSPAPRSARQT